jgi:hypothetical protein
MKPMNRWMTLVIALLLVLVLVACDEGNDEADPETLAEPPQVYLLTDEGPVASAHEHYCWNTQADTPADFDAATEMCSQVEQPDFTSFVYTPVAITENTPLRVELEEPLPERITLALSSPNEIFALATTDDNNPQETIVEWVPDGISAGDYILVALAYWGDAGGAAYYYPITVQ